MNTKIYTRALNELQNMLAQVKARHELQDIIESRDVVLQRYKPIFTLANIPYLIEEDFRSFLYFGLSRN